MFMIQLVGSMKILVKYPVTVRVGNVGAIFMVSNTTATWCTNHADVMYKYVNECNEITNAIFSPKMRVLSFMRSIQRR